MGFKVTGNAGTDAEVEAGSRRLRVVPGPMDHGARGAYSASFITGILGAALGANSEIFQFRFVHASYFALVRSIKLSASVSTTFFAAGVPVQIEGRSARAWTAVGTGGTGITFAGNDAKKRTDFGSTVLAANDVRIATTAALGAGTKTLDGTAFASIVAGGPITASLNGTIFAPHTILYQRDTSEEYPLLYENQEGFVIRSVAVPATGTWTASVTIEWSEIDPSVITGW